MRPFRFERATGAEHAVTLLGDALDARYLGGGTNLVDLMRLGVETPGTLIDVTRLVDHDRIDETDSGGLRIGGAVRNSDLAADSRVRERYPVLAEAVLQGASGQLRNLATVGGNLLQRTRCAYFTDVTKPCNKRAPGTGCPAREGRHHNHAVLGHSQHCVATHPSDMAVALVALGATVHVRGPAGARIIPIPGFHRLPGDAPHRDTLLEPGELITAVELGPPPGPRTRQRYRKVRERRSFAFALVSVAAVLDLERGGTVSDVRIALGGVAHMPWRATRAEDALRGAPITPELVSEAAQAELEHAQPLRENSYKVELAHSLIAATLLELAE
ncbi:MAG: xanthine dehydrogenase family protein subunit M [Solirubrobacterales bacterium]|nr:xanthine dehydrogenase family protein subunit M [Solirubrobacterales bacterium]MBV9941005.1 xanthine dehydrogenase family protein subunit M [Solirubrobacterales bacterium]